MTACTTPAIAVRYPDAGIPSLDSTWSGRPDVLELLPVGVVVVAEDDRILLCNRAGRDLLERLDGPGTPHRLARIGSTPLAVLRSPREDLRPHEVTTRTPGGVIVEVQATLTEWDVGRPATVLILRDVTRLREMEGMANANHRLAAVGQLAAGIAHDFNNLLTGILGFAEILRLGPSLNEQSREDLETIISQARRAAGLIRQILDFSRQSVARKQGLDLVPFVKECTKLLQRTLPETVSVDLEIMPGEYLVTGDPTQLQQMITNLAINARDAMPDGGRFSVRIRPVRLEPGDPRPFRAMPSGRFVEICFADTGVGMSPEVQARCFEPFFTTKEVGSGTGLGLAQVFGIIKQHSGFIVARSAPRQGAEFTVWLPLRTTPATSTEAASAAPDVTSGRGERVLVVEDDPSVRRILLRAVAKLGYSPVEATNGAEALALLEARSRDVSLVISDVTMPVVGGLELFHRARSAHPDLPFVFITGYAMADVDEALRREPHVKLMGKPLSLPLLAEAMRNLLERSPRRPA